MRLLYPAITAVGLFLAGCSAEYWTGKTTMRTELSVRTPMGGLHFIDTLQWGRGVVATEIAVAASAGCLRR